MAGTLEITDQLCWMPAGWVYDNVLEKLGSLLRSKDPVLSKKLLDSLTDKNGGYLDLRTLDPRSITQLVQASDEAYKEYETSGAESFHDPAFYPGFMKQFRELREMLMFLQQNRLQAS